MKRRQFITLLVGTAATWPLAAHAQQTDRMRRIGVIFGGAEGDPDAVARFTAFLQVLQQLGWTEGRNIRIEYRWARVMPATLANMQRNWSPSHPT
jgi:putative ABC transport system substrate-binding protein